jgi:ankyrin repeat protein
MAIVDVFDLIRNEQYDTMKSLILDGIVDINVRDRNGNTILHYLSSRNVPELVEWTLNHGATKCNVNAVNRWDRTSLNNASIYGDVDVIKILLQYGALPNIQNRAGNTVLHDNIDDTRSEIVELLLQYGADVTITNLDGKTPLDIAIQCEFSEIEDIINRYLNPEIEVKEPVED